MKNKIFFCLIFCGFFHNVFPQEITQKDIFIISYEVIEKKYNNTYYWVLPIDSVININTIVLCPLYFDEYSNDNLDNCRKGNIIDLFTSTSTTNYDFSEEYIKERNHLTELINKNKQLIQEIRINWSERKKLKRIVKIFVTPIQGQFCECIQYYLNNGRMELDFFTKAYIPLGSFAFLDNFQQSELGKSIKFIDFSKLDYTSHFPYSDRGHFEPILFPALINKRVRLELENKITNSPNRNLPQ